MKRATANLECTLGCLAVVAASPLNMPFSMSVLALLQIRLGAGGARRRSGPLASSALPTWQAPQQQSQSPGRHQPPAEAPNCRQAPPSSRGQTPHGQAPTQHSPYHIALGTHPTAGASCTAAGWPSPPCGRGHPRSLQATTRPKAGTSCTTTCLWLHSPKEHPCKLSQARVWAGHGVP